MRSLFAVIMTVFFMFVVPGCGDDAETVPASNTADVTEPSDTQDNDTLSPEVTDDASPAGDDSASTDEDASNTDEDASNTDEGGE